MIDLTELTGDITGSFRDFIPFHVTSFVHVTSFATKSNERFYLENVFDNYDERIQEINDNGIES